MTYYLDFVDSICISGGAVNADRVGATRNAAWVVDGATDLVDRQILPGDCDAAWFADALNRHLGKPTLWDVSGNFSISEVVEAIKKEFFAQQRRQIVNRYEQPSAAGVVMRLYGESASVFSLGDCSLVHVKPGEPAYDLCGPNVTRRLQELDASVTKLINSHSGSNAETNSGVLVAAIDLLRKNRGKMNMQEGYGIFSVDEPDQSQAFQSKVKLSANDLILLATDGFMRIFYKYEMYQLAETEFLLKAKGLVGIAYELRQFEAHVRSDKKTIQTKRADDAAAILLRVRHG